VIDAVCRVGAILVAITITPLPQTTAIYSFTTTQPEPVDFFLQQMSESECAKPRPLL
jgi:hypothetical protein